MKNFKKFICFCFVGGSSAFIDWVIFNLSYVFFGAGFITARIFATCIAVVYNFFMNRNVTFSAKGIPIKKQILKYSIVYSLSIATNFITSILVLKIIGESILNANISVISGIIISIPIGFFGSLLWTFKK